MKCTIYFNYTRPVNFLWEQNYTEAKSEVCSFGENQKSSSDTEHKVKKDVCWEAGLSLYSDLRLVTCDIGYGNYHKNMCLGMVKGDCVYEAGAIRKLQVDHGTQQNRQDYVSIPFSHWYLCWKTSFYRSESRPMRKPRNAGILYSLVLFMTLISTY